MCTVFEPKDLQMHFREQTMLSLQFLIKINLKNIVDVLK